jgi:RNA polymerase sigma-70 factor (ECF subfamily)
MSTLTVHRDRREPRERELEEVFREHYPMLYRTAYSILNSSADAEDVPQTIFLRLLRTGVPPDVDNIKGYLYRSAVNLSLNVLRSRRREILTNDADCREIPIGNSESASAEDLHRRLTEAIAELTPEAAQVVILRYVHDYSDAQIAKLLGTSRGVIAMKLFRARARLKKLVVKESSGETT